MNGTGIDLVIRNGVSSKDTENREGFIYVDQTNKGG